MRCPYQSIVTHIGHQYPSMSIEDITEFYKCIKSECPFYYTTEYKPARQITEHCSRAEKEYKHEH